VIEDHPDFILRFTPDRRVSFVNAACCKFYGLRRDEILGRDALDLVHPEDRAAVAAYFLDADPAQPLWTTEHRAIVPGASPVRWLHRFDRPLHDSQGNLIEYQAVLRDVTELRVAQEQAQRIGKLITLGQIVAGITHELNQPLSAASLAAQNALFDIESGPAPDAVYLQEKLGSIVDRLGHMGDIVNHLRTFVRPSNDKAAAADVIEVIRRSIALVENQLRLDGIGLQLALPPTCRRARATPLDLETILVNLLTNARDAIVRARATAAPDAAAAGCVHIAVDDLDVEAAIRFVVRDDGGGVPDELLDRLFDPFVTTKQVGEGMGLGLSIVHQTVANLGGTIEVCNVMGGAEFRIKIPVAMEG
jgi:PAS domain S-box-containing protein